MPKAPLSTSTDLPDQQEASRALDDARRLFGRTLASWAGDVLALRRCGGTVAKWPEREHASDARRAA